MGTTKTTKTNGKCCGTSKNCADERWTAQQIATFIAEASTPSEKGTATRRLKQYVAQRSDAGCDPTRVEANIRSLANRLGRGK